MSSAPLVMAVLWHETTARIIAQDPPGGGGGGILQISSDGDDQMGAKIKTQKNP